MVATTEALRCVRALALAVLLIADAPIAAATDRVTIRTEDGVSLAGTWYGSNARTAPAVILIHMLHRSRRDWDGVASRLASEGIGALAIDLRGHGDSGGSAGGGDSPDYSAMIRDVSAARRYLASRSDVVQSRVGMAGASLGANLAVLETSGDSSVASLVLLSPSLDYRGLRIEAAFRKVGDRPVLLVSSDDDPYATRSVRDLRKAGGGTREVLLLNHAGHGTVMLGRDAELTTRLVDWFRRTLL
jgi:alpha-beta hydrolase superfamily lysophospholipase